jgi:hypothetical protein
MSGVIGRLTPTMAPTWRPHMPAALTAISVRTTPRSVSTPVTSPRGPRRIPVTRTPVRTVTPSWRARPASSMVAPLGSM